MWSHLLFLGFFYTVHFVKAIAKSSVLSNYMKLGALHREFAMVATVWGFLLCITGVWIGGFFIANDSYNADVLHTAKARTFRLVNLKYCNHLKLSLGIMKAYPDRQAYIYGLSI